MLQTDVFLRCNARRSICNVVESDVTLRQKDEIEIIPENGCLLYFCVGREAAMQHLFLLFKGQFNC